MAHPIAVLVVDDEKVIANAHAPHHLFQVQELIVEHASGRCALLVATLHVAFEEQQSSLLRMRQIGEPKHAQGGCGECQDFHQRPPFGFTLGCCVIL